MTVKLLTEHHLEFLSLKEAIQAHLSLHLSKGHIVGNHMSRLKPMLYNLCCAKFRHNNFFLDLGLHKQSYVIQNIQ